jgi:TolB-like protein/DNA-binding winged helix-turn-helix (wHTH) protein
MVMSQLDKHLYEFGPFRFYPTERYLLREGEVVPLPPKVFDILLFLVQNHGHLLQKDKIIKAIWPESFVEEGNLTRYISTLRQALGEGQNGQTYIETVPRIGYRFVAEVREIGSKGFDPAAHSLAVEEKREGDQAADSDLSKEAYVLSILSNGKLAAPRVRLWALSASVIVLLALGWLGLAMWKPEKSVMPKPPAIAVIPFKNHSAEPESEYFVDGLTDEIIRNLSLIEGLEVRSRTSSFAFKDKPRNIREVGKQLKVDWVVEGSVLRSAGNLRVNVQFVQVADDFPLWSCRFDRELKDVFAIQDEISQGIVNNLRLKLSRGRRRYETSVEAYSLYLHARALPFLADPSFGETIERSNE